MAAYGEPTIKNHIRRSAASPNSYCAYRDFLTGKSSLWVYPCREIPVDGGWLLLSQIQHRYVDYIPMKKEALVRGGQLVVWGLV
jgi:hypothetical protein